MAPRSFVKINGKLHYLWRAVDQHGNVLDVLVQSHRNGNAAKRFLRKLLNRLEYVPRVIVTDKLASYQVAHREMLASVEHRRSKYFQQPGREFSSADPTAGAGDETIHIARARRWPANGPVAGSVSMQSPRPQLSPTSTPNSSTTPSSQPGSSPGFPPAGSSPRQNCCCPQRSC